MTGKSSTRRSKIFASALLGAGLLATCAAASPGSPATSRVVASTAAATTGVTLANPGGQVAKVLPETVSLQLSATDSSGSALTYTATGLPLGTSIDPATGLVSGTVTAYYDGTASVTATDAGGASATVSFSWLAENVVAVSESADDETIAAGTQVSLPFTATDSAAGQTFTFSATGLPPGLALNPTSGVVAGSTVVDGMYTVIVTATDSSGSQGSVKNYWYVTSKPSITSPGNLTTTAGQLAQISLQVGDTASNAALDYEVAGGPPGAYANWNSATTDGWRTATLTGWAAPAGTYKTTITLLGDVSSTASVTFTWTVKPGSGTGPTGPVRLYLAGLCLDDTNNSSVNGNKVQLWSCLNHTNQMWTAAYAAELAGAQSGLCLADPASSTKNGTQVELGDCNEGAGVTWTLPAGEILSGVPGQCITDSGAATANGTQIVLGKCSDSSDQQWTFGPDGSLRIFGKCLSTPDLTFGAEAVLEPCGGPYSYQWDFGDVNQIGALLGDSDYDLRVPATASGTQLELGNAAGPGANWFFW